MDTTMELHGTEECKAGEHEKCPPEELRYNVYCPECEDWVPCGCDCHD